MTTRSSRRSVGARNSLGILVLVGVIGCSTEPIPAITGKVSPRLSLAEVTVGSRTTAVVSLGGGPNAGELIGLEGRLRFNPAAARYVGQEVAGSAVLMVGEAGLAKGELRFALLDRSALAARAAAFAFERLAPEVDLGLALEITQAANRNGEPVPTLIGPYRAGPSSVAPADSPRRMTLADWYARFEAPKSETRSGLQLVPGQGLIYGDVNLSGAVNLFDVIAMLNVAAGAQPLLTDVNRDVAVAGDVSPANAPGLGEFDDPVPPGLEADGTRRIDIFDAIAIQNFAAGVPQPVAGQPVPGHVLVANRAVLTGVLLADRTLSRDTVYELDGMVIVTNGAVLRIPAGTRIEGNSSTRGALSIRRGSQLIVTGTRLEPVVMTCTAPVKTPGCWAGLQLNGAASVNNGNTGSGTTIQCPELTAPGGFGIYGGCVNASSSGAIQYLRVEYAGAPAGSTPIAGLQLLGVGSGTALANIQVHRSLGTGLRISGGAAQLRQVVLTDNGGVGMEWDDGWQGKAQQLVIHRGNSSGVGLLGSNAPNGVTVVGQQSMPSLFNVTLLGPGAPGAGAPGILLHQGTGGLLRNLLVQGFDGPGLDINDQATCDAVTNGMLVVSNGIFFQNTPDFAADADCVDESALAADPQLFLTVANPGLIAPGLAASPDWRPGFGSPASAGGAPPPIDGFFDPNLVFLGAVAAANITLANIPWYVGWTVGWN